HLSTMAGKFGGDRSVNSLIEPLMDMMVQRILVKRYPQYAPYQMSCFAQTSSAANYHWCQDCAVCAKMYVLCVGGGVDPAAVGFTVDMLGAGNRRFFTLFGASSSLPYARSELALEVQLFAFYCAAKF